MTQTQTIVARLQRLLIAAGTTVLLAAAPAQAAYVLSEFTRPGATSTSLWDINNNGAMVGYSFAAGSANPQAFVYEAGSFTSLAGPAGAIASYAMGISDGGRVVGSYVSSMVDDGTGTMVLGPATGFLYAGGVYTTFSVAGATDTFLRGISPDGRYITGYYSDALRAGNGFVYDLLTATFRSTSAPDSLLTIAQGVTNAGLVVGSDTMLPAPLTRPGFYYDTATDTRTDAAIAGMRGTRMRAIGEDGTLAGWFIDATGDIHGFVGDLVDYETVDFAGADQTYIEGSNNARDIVGMYYVGDEVHAYVGRAVPEPQSAALLLAAALAAGAATRRRRG